MRHLSTFEGNSDQRFGRSRGILVAVVLVTCGLGGRCGGPPADGTGGPDPDGSIGCSGTRGDLGRIALVFEESPWSDYSAESGNAFAAGTTEPFTLMAVDSSDGLPLLTPRSMDPSVFAVDVSTDPAESHVLDLRTPGTATLQLEQSDGTVYDHVALRVAAPERILLWAMPLGADPMMLDFHAEEPARIWIAPDSGCRLAFGLAEQEGDFLLGQWIPEVLHADTLASFAEGRLSVGADAYVPVHLHALLGMGAGEEGVTLRGPGGVSREVTVTVDDAAPIDHLTLYLPSASDATLDVGDSFLLSVMGRTAAGEPAYGYAAEVYSSDPGVVSVARDVTTPDAATLSVLAAGVVTITAVLADDPLVTGSVTVAVQESGAGGL